MASALILALGAGCVRESKTVTSTVNVPNTPVLALKDMNRVATVELTSPEGTAYSLKAVSLPLSATAGLGDIRKVALIVGDETVAETDVMTKSHGKKIKIIY